MTPQLATKAEFAALINVSPGRISQHIAEGKLGPNELEGTGRSAKIKVPEALAALKLRLDAAQMLGNGLGTKLNVQPAAQAPSRQQAAEDDLDLQLKQAKLAQQLAINARHEEEAKARAGVYVLAADSKAEMARLAAELMQSFEGGLSDIATALAAQYQLPQRDVVHMVRKQFREVRAKIAERLRDDAKLHPQLTEQDDTQH